MELFVKTHLSGDKLNSNGTVRGAELFEYADVAGYTFCNEKFLLHRPDLMVATNNADFKFLGPAYAYGFVEVFAEVGEVTPARIDVRIKMMVRDNKDSEWRDCLRGTFSFTVISRETRKIHRLTKEEMYEIKG
jgi:acyl-CoA hydrolase